MGNVQTPHLASEEDRADIEKVKVVDVGVGVEQALADVLAVVHSFVEDHTDHRVLEADQAVEWYIHEALEMVLDQDDVVAVDQDHQASVYHQEKTLAFVVVGVVDLNIRT